MNEQQTFWAGEFGSTFDNKSDRRIWEINTNTEFMPLVGSFFSLIAEQASIIDYGCGDGVMIDILKYLGFKNITGVEINKDKIEYLKKRYKGEYTFIHSSIEDCEAKKFDVSIHSGLLIHINPTGLDSVMKKIYDNTNQYIFGVEVSTPHPEDLGDLTEEWQGKLWSRRWVKKWQNLYPDLELVKHKLIHSRVENQAETEVFLLRKKKDI